MYDDSPYFAVAGRRLVDVAAVKPGSRVLDIATGTGAVLFPLVERAGANGHVTGVDFAPAMVASATAEIARRGITTADVRVMSAEALDFPAESFDLATCGFALWFIPDLKRALSEALRVLRPGGGFAVSTWGPPDAIDRRHNQMLVDFGGTAPDLSSHVLRTAADVAAILDAAGFEVDYAADESVSVVFAGPERWWEQRMAVPKLNTLTIPAHHQERFKREAQSMASEYLQPDGIHQTRKAVFAVGVKPA